MKLFGSSGIRGISNRDITPDLALNVGKAAGMGRSTAVIARDPRISAQMIEEAVAAGLMSSGCNVTGIGLVPTPTLAYATKDYDLGIMITASHNPAQYIGIKLWNPDGMAFDSTQQEEIEEIIASSRYSPVAWNRIGSQNTYPNAVQDHINIILARTDPLRSAPKVVVDCGNGAGSVITPLLLRMLGCRVLSLNAQPDGYFPARNPEPKADNLGLLMRTVREWGADVGIAHDGDADRMMAVDDKGRFVDGDQLLAIFAAHEQATKIVVPVDTSLVVDDALPGTEIIRSRVGDVYVAEAMKKQGAIFGGEPSGSWIFPRISFCPDGIYAAIRLMEIMDGEKLSAMIDALPRYHTRRIGIACENARKDDAMTEIARELSPMGDVSTIDGIRVETRDGWVLVRPSGTEPLVRVTAEGRSNVDDLFREVCRVVKVAAGSACS